MGWDWRPERARRSIRSVRPAKVLPMRRAVVRMDVGNFIVTGDTLYQMLAFAIGVDCRS